MLYLKLAPNVKFSAHQQQVRESSQTIRSFSFPEMDQGGPSHGASRRVVLLVVPRVRRVKCLEFSSTTCSTRPSERSSAFLNALVFSTRGIPVALRSVPASLGAIQRVPPQASNAHFLPRKFRIAEDLVVVTLLISSFSVLRDVQIRTYVSVKNNNFEMAPPQGWMDSPRTRADKILLGSEFFG
jgi:hypothetical protein